MWIKVVVGVGQFAKLVINRGGVKVQYKGDTKVIADKIIDFWKDTTGTFGDRVDFLEELLITEYVGR